MNTAFVVFIPPVVIALSTPRELPVVEVSPVGLMVQKCMMMVLVDAMVVWTTVTVAAVLAGRSMNMMPMQVDMTTRRR
jgi:hypothetical protein